jgi:hypothetical protein
MTTTFSSYFIQTQYTLYAVSRQLSTGQILANSGRACKSQYDLSCCQPDGVVTATNSDEQQQIYAVLADSHFVDIMYHKRHRAEVAPFVMKDCNDIIALDMELRFGKC